MTVEKKVWAFKWECEVFIKQDASEFIIEKKKNYTPQSKFFLLTKSVNVRIF